MRWLAPTLDKTTGYLHVSVCENGEKQTERMHRLIASAFIDNPDGLVCVNHKNEDKTDNRPSNLEWCTYQYNVSYGTARKRAVETVGIEALRESAARAREIRIRAYRRPVRNVNTGRVFESIRKAADEYGLRQTGIYGACTKRQKTCGGYQWEYADEVKA